MLLWRSRFFTKPNGFENHQGMRCECMWTELPLIFFMDKFKNLHKYTFLLNNWIKYFNESKE